MDLLKTVNAMTPVIKEDAAGGAVGAGGVAAFSTPLFSSLVKRSMPTEPTLSPYAKDKGEKKKKKKKGLGLQEAFDDMAGAQPGNPDASTDGGTVPAKNGFDNAGVVSKLKDLERKEKDDYRDSVTFGLEDENGGLVRVTVKAEQAPQFEEALQSFLGRDEDDDKPMEIGEILFKLKDQFDIVDVVWPDVEEDEEEDTIMGDNQAGDLAGDDMAGAEGGMPGAEGDLGEMPPVEEPAGEDQATSILTQVIDMMKSDAEARKAEARAREAEAKAKEADAVVKQVMSKVKQEEQFLDMEAYNKAKKEEDRETKRLAQLAKWKHDTEKEGGDVGSDTEFGGEMPAPAMGQPAAPEEEERAYIRPAPKPQPQRKATTGARVSPHDVANFILNRVKR